jgi:hypothetical protein
MFLYFLVFIFQFNLFGIEELPKDLKFSNQEYVIRLYNGDVFKAIILQEIEDKVDGKGIKVESMLGVINIYLDEIDEIRKAEKYNRHLHRHFVMPTAEPIGDDYFIGLWELAFAYAGFGITDYFSVTLGRSFVPYIGYDNQLSVVNLKGTFINRKFYDPEGKEKGAFILGGGANLSWINNDNPFRHYYAVATFKGKTSRLTTNLFYKNSGEDIYTLKFGQAGNYIVSYPDGKIGVGLGLEDQLWNWRGVNILLELWNTDFTKPSSTGVFLGFRLFNSKFSTDFGIAFFTEPFVAPFVNFVFTPF